MGTRQLGVRCETGMTQLQVGKVGMRQLQGVQSRYKTATRGVRQLQGCEAGTRQLLGV